MAASDPFTVWQGLTALAPLVGGGGVASIIVAWMGYRRSVMSGGKSATIGPDATLAIGALYADRDSLERLGASAERLIDAIDRLGNKFSEKTESGIDEVRELRRAVQDLRDTVGRPRRKER